MVIGPSTYIKIISDNGKEIITQFLKSAGQSLVSFRYFEKRTFDVLKNHIVTCMLFQDDLPVGYGHLDADGGRVWLGIAVAESYKGKGYGSSIMIFLLSKAKENNIPTISLTVDTDNKIAINLYKNCGFNVVSLLNEKVYLMEYNKVVL